MHVENTRTLLLTQGHEPIKVISWQRAMTLLTLAKVDVIEEYDAEIRATALVIRVPAVVRLRNRTRGATTFTGRVRSTTSMAPTSSE